MICDTNQEHIIYTISLIAHNIKTKKTQNKIFKEIVTVFEKKYGNVNLSNKYKEFDKWVVMFDSEKKDKRIAIIKGKVKNNLYYIMICYYDRYLLENSVKINEDTI